MECGNRHGVKTLRSIMFISYRVPYVGGEGTKRRVDGNA